jgi:hypothetical protein
VISVSAKYKSDVPQALARMRKQVGEILEQSARVGAATAARLSDPHVGFTVGEPEDRQGVITVVVYSNPAQFWAVMFDKGTLGSRKVSLKQPGRRRMQWTSHHRKSGKEFTARRHPDKLVRGGIEPEYFEIRGQRRAEQRRDELFKAWSKRSPPQH